MERGLEDANVVIGRARARARGGVAVALGRRSRARSAGEKAAFTGAHSVALSVGVGLLTTIEKAGERVAVRVAAFLASNKLSIELGRKDWSSDRNGAEKGNNGSELHLDRLLRTVSAILLTN